MRSEYFEHVARVLHHTAGVTSVDARLIRNILRWVFKHAAILIAEHDMVSVSLRRGDSRFGRGWTAMNRGSPAEISSDPAVRAAYLGKWMA